MIKIWLQCIWNISFFWTDPYWSWRIVYHRTRHEPLELLWLQQKKFEGVKPLNDPIMTTEILFNVTFRPSALILYMYIVLLYFSLSFKWKLRLPSPLGYVFLKSQSHITWWISVSKNHFNDKNNKFCPLKVGSSLYILCMTIIYKENVITHFHNNLFWYTYINHNDPWVQTKCVNTVSNTVLNVEKCAANVVKL